MGIRVLGPRFIVSFKRQGLHRIIFSLFQCLDINSVFTFISPASNLKLTEEEFHTSCLVTLYFLSKGSHPCHATLTPDGGNLTLAAVKADLVTSLSAGDGNVSLSSLEAFLHDLEDNVKGKERFRKYSRAWIDFYMIRFCLILEPFKFWSWKPKVSVLYAWNYWPKAN